MKLSICVHLPDLASLHVLASRLCDGQASHVTGQYSDTCFHTSHDWYDIKVLKHDTTYCIEQLSNSTASDWTCHLYAVSCIKTSKVLHAGQLSGSQLAEANGVPEAEVSSILSVYLS